MGNQHPSHLAEVSKLFLRLGLTAYGGPAAHISMMHDEVVKRRQWLSEQHFLDLLGATNLIPGPNSTEMAIHLGFWRAGWPGLVLAGLCFIIPAMLAVLALAWAYVEYGATPAAEWLLYGVKPVVIAVVVQALWGLGQKAYKGPLTALVGLAVMGLYFLQVNILLPLVAGGLVVMLWQNRSRLRGRDLLLGLPWPSLDLTFGLPIGPSRRHRPRQPGFAIFSNWVTGSLLLSITSRLTWRGWRQSVRSHGADFGCRPAPAYPFCLVRAQ